MLLSLAVLKCLRFCDLDFMLPTYLLYISLILCGICVDGKLRISLYRGTRVLTVHASYAVALQLAKAKKPLADGELIKRCAIEMAKAFGDNNLGKMKQVMHDCKYFSLALDESTDVTDVSQLLIFTRTIDGSFEVHEELLKLVLLHDTTRGTDIFNAVNNVARAYRGFDKLSAVVTDGAPAMQGRHTGFEGLLQQNRANCPILHCIIHQEALCARTLDFSHVMDLVTKITKLIREDSVHGDTSAYCRKLKDTAFLCDIAFLTDITSHLNHLNTNLQGKHQTVCELYAHMTTFQNKLELFWEGFSSRFLNLTHFPACEEKQKMSLSVRNYFTNIRPTSKNSDAVSEQPSELQLELCDLQSDPFFQARRNEKGNSFWKLLPDMFGSTYICESSFLTMKHIKSKERNRLRDDTLFHLIRIGCTEFDIDIQSIVHQQAKPRVSH
uniref:HAT C-terminal dimerisation domain-containing protein n=1 Tax=Monopterus albus TaxID=43700 RepID=A0A3Q3JZ16_MONAL